ncbi:ankyrin repeat-containing domain protein [Chytridium lagenaria]|nr:ankyrin repeat-containing domain protein [Chytridium lagenaria]
MMATGEGHHIFVSYAWSNSMLAHQANPSMSFSGAAKSDPRKIAQALVDEGYKVWLDVNELRAGKDLHAQLATALDKRSKIPLKISLENFLKRWRIMSHTHFITETNINTSYTDNTNGTDSITCSGPSTSVTNSHLQPQPQLTHPNTSVITPSQSTSQPVEEDPLAGLSPEERLLALSANGDTKQLKKILTAGRVNVEVKGANGWTPLNQAAYNGHLEAVNMLLKAGASIDTQSSTGWTPLASACLMGHLDVVQFLVLRNADIEALTVHRWTPLYSASYSGHTEVVSWLIAQGANVKFGPFGIRKVLVEEGNAELECKNDDVMYLVVAGADPNALTNMGLTPLHAAASLGFMEIVCYLIHDVGVRLDITSSHGWTPMHAACFSGHVEVVKELYKCGLHNFEERTDDHCTPFFLAASKNSLDVMDYLRSLGASLDITNKKGWTPLIAASAGGHLEAVEWLISKGSHVNVTDNEGKTALYLAIEQQHIPVAEYLLENSFSIAACDVSDEDGITPLMLAVTHEYENLIHMLLQKGASKTKRNNEGKTAVDFAIATDNQVIVDLLASSSHNLPVKGILISGKKVHPEEQDTGIKAGAAAKTAGTSWHDDSRPTMGPSEGIYVPSKMPLKKIDRRIEEQDHYDTRPRKTKRATNGNGVSEVSEESRAEPLPPPRNPLTDPRVFAPLLLHIFLHKSTSNILYPGLKSLNKRQHSLWKRSRPLLMRCFVSIPVIKQLLFDRPWKNGKWLTPYPDVMDKNIRQYGSITLLNAEKASLSGTFPASYLTAMQTPLLVTRCVLFTVFRLFTGPMCIYYAIQGEEGSTVKEKLQRFWSKYRKLPLLVSVLTVFNVLSLSGLNAWWTVLVYKALFRHFRAMSSARMTAMSGSTGIHHI